MSEVDFSSNTSSFVSTNFCCCSKESILFNNSVNFCALSFLLLDKLNKYKSKKAIRIAPPIIMKEILLF